MKKLKFLMIILFVAGISPFFITATTSAQEQNGWSAPYRLSSDGSAASESYMLSDPYGFVHVFWAEKTDTQHAVIQYARFDGNSWSTPIDIYTTRPTPEATIGFISPFLDQNDTLHVIWTQGSAGPAFYATAPLFGASSAHSWSAPTRIDIPAAWIRLVVDSEGILHSVYTNAHAANPGVYYIRSEDTGYSWTDPEWLDPDIPDDHQPLWLQFGIDESDGLHVVWNYLKTGELGKDVRYTHSLDGGVTWSLPFTIDTPKPDAPDELRMAHPGLVVDGQTIHVVWGGGAGGDQGGNIHREYRYSTNAGESWSLPLQFFNQFTGQAAGAGMAIDGSGRLHYLTQVRHPKAIWHTYWNQYGWSPPEMVYLIARYDKDPMEQERIHAHNVRLAIRNGNELVMTFTNSPGEEEPLTLYVMHRTLDDIPPLPAKPIPSLTATPDTSEPTMIPTIPPSILATPTPRSLELDAPVEDIEDSSPTIVLWLAIAPVLLLVGGIIAFRLLSKN